VNSDVSITATVLEEATWLLNGKLPEAAEAPATLQHRGVTYTYVGYLERLTGGQYEALADFTKAAQAEGRTPVAVAHQLLAVLYAPAPVETVTQKARRFFGFGQKPAPRKPTDLTADMVAQSAKAFETLPVSVAYPIILHFFHSGSRLAGLTQLFSAVAPAALKALETLEQAQLSSGSPEPYMNFRPWLLQTWIRHAKQLCLPSSTRSSIGVKSSRKRAGQRSLNVPPISLN
jgi:hypothetical protein